MKIISIWQPWASLLLSGHKLFETRGWTPPASLLNQTIGIASTKQIRAIQLRAFQNPEFQRHYATTGLPGQLEELPLGCILGTITLEAAHLMTPELMESAGERERMFGDWSIGRYAWRVTKPVIFETPIPARGMQGLWDYDLEAQARSYQAGSPAAGGDLHAA